MLWPLDPRIPFVGVLPQNRAERPARRKLLRENGAVTILNEVRDLESRLARARRPLL